MRATESRKSTTECQSFLARKVWFFFWADSRSMSFCREMETLPRAMTTTKMIAK